MKIVDVNNPDTGNQSYKVAQAINMTYAPKHVSVSFIRNPNSNYLNFPYMVRYKEPLKKWIKDWWSNADIIHVHNFPSIINAFRCADLVKPDAVKILHQHCIADTDKRGPYFGMTPEQVKRHDSDNRYFRVVSTINLLKWVGNDSSRWIPAPINISKMDRIKEKYYEEHDTIRIVHSPTNKEGKQTSLFLNVMEKIMKKHDNVELVYIEKKSNDECLKIKCSCDICYDQMRTQYGSNALESWAFGIPCVVGSPFEKQIKKVIGYLPYYKTTQETLFDSIEALVVDEKKRREYGNMGRRYVEEFHDYPVVADKVIKLYERAKKVM